MRKIQLFIMIAFAFVALSEAKEQADSGFLDIRNDTFWNTVDGSPLYSQGGGIFRFADPQTGIYHYYWYGMHYKEAELYRQNPVADYSTNSFVSVTCYRSDDFVNWTFVGDVLTKAEVERHVKPTWLGRMGVAYLDAIRKYALFIQCNEQVLVALSDTPTGEFRWDHLIDMTDRIGTSNTGDQTVFTDEDTGKSYLIYCNGQGRNNIYLSEIGVVNQQVDLVDCRRIYHGAGREGNCMFKYGGKYYMCSSNLYGWDCSFAYYLVADQIQGPYLPKDSTAVFDGCKEDFAHVTQTGFFYTIHGSKHDLVLYCGDRWADFAGNGLGYNQWLPISFRGAVPYFNSLSSWCMNPRTGEWHVNSDNNYARNGSFEADRRSIPNPVKPVQDYLLGWNTMVLKGNRVAVNAAASPVLNYVNTAEDRQSVVGEKSLYINDKVDFSRKISQRITSTPFVTLSDGRYELMAKVKRCADFSRLDMYAVSGGERWTAPLPQSPDTWVTVKISPIRVTGGQVEIGFIADGKAGSWCRVDDITFIPKD